MRIVSLDAPPLKDSQGKGYKSLSFLVISAAVFHSHPLVSFFLIRALQTGKMSTTQFDAVSNIAIEPQYIASFVLIALFGFIVVKRDSIHSQWLYLQSFSVKRRKAIETAKLGEIVASRDSMEPELLDK